MIGIGISPMFQDGAVLNFLPTITLPASSLITDTGMTVAGTVDNGKLSTVWSIEYGTTNAYGSTAAGGTITEPTSVSKALTGLSQNTLYYWRIKAVNSKGTTYSTGQTATTTNLELFATITQTGTGTGLSEFRLTISETQVLTLSGTARFYDDAAGTVNESTTFNVVTGASRMKYVKAGAGNSILNIPKPNKVISWGDLSAYGWFGGINKPALYISFTKMNSLTILRSTGTIYMSGALPSTLTYLFLHDPSNNINWTYSGALPSGITSLYMTSDNINWTYSGALPSGLTGLSFSANNVNWTYSGALPSGITSLSIYGNLLNYTSLDFGCGNLTTLICSNFRITKISSVDMVTLLTNLTNRTGTLPATMTINDYADYAAPPQSVINAVAALKAAKSITTVNLGV